MKNQFFFTGIKKILPGIDGAKKTVKKNGNNTVVFKNRMKIFLRVQKIIRTGKEQAMACTLSINNWKPRQSSTALNTSLQSRACTIIERVLVKKLFEMHAVIIFSKSGCHVLALFHLGLKIILKGSLFESFKENSRHLKTIHF